MAPVDTRGWAELCPGCTEPAVSFHLQPLKHSLSDDFTPEATQMQLVIYENLYLKQVNAQ